MSERVTAAAIESAAESIHRARGRDSGARRASGPPELGARPAFARRVNWAMLGLTGPVAQGFRGACG
jgi:hypothetical protein